MNILKIVIGFFRKKKDKTPDTFILKKKDKTPDTFILKKANKKRKKMKTTNKNKDVQDLADRIKNAMIKAKY